MQPWKLLDASLVVSASPWLELYRETVVLPSGRIIEDFYRVVLPDFSVVVAVTEEKQLVMVRGYKHGLKRICLSAPAGLLEPSEAALAAAQRELLEETGYAATDWKSLGSFIVDGNRQCGTMHLFLARHARWVKPCRSDDAEELQVELMSPRRLLQAIQEGEIAHLPTASALALALVVGLE